MTGTAPSWIELLFWIMLGAAEPTTEPPLPAEAYLEYLPESCEFLFAADVRGTEAGHQAIRDRWNRPELLTVPDVSAGLSVLETRLLEVADHTRAVIGLEPFSLHTITICGNLGMGSLGMPTPRVVLSLSGPDGFADGLFELFGAELPAIPVDGHRAFRDEYNEAIIYEASPGRVLWGWEGFVEPHLGAGSSATPAVGSTNARLAELAPAGVRWYVGLDPSTGLQFLAATLTTRSFGTHLAHLERAAIVGNDDVVYIEADVLNAEAAADYELMAAGLEGLARATPILFESLTSLILGSARPGDTAYSPQVLALVESREAIFDLLREAGAFAPPTIERQTDAATHTVTLTATDSRGFQLLVRQLLLLGALAAEGELPETMRSFETIPRWWGSRLLDSP